MALLFASSGASALVWVGGGVEYYTSATYYDYYDGVHWTTEDYTRESGFMPYVEANADIPVTDRLRVSLSGRAYGGDVDFTHSATGADSLPRFEATNQHTGARAEAGINFSPLPPGETKEVAFVAVVGTDVSTRELNGSAYPRKEEWTLPFVRLGAQLDAPETGGWGGRGGLIYPFGVTVSVNGTDRRPDPAPSFYLGFGRRFQRFFEAGFNYEGFRFSRHSEDYLRTEADIYQIYLKMGF